MNKHNLAQETPHWPNLNYLDWRLNLMRIPLKLKLESDMTSLIVFGMFEQHANTV